MRKREKRVVQKKKEARRNIDRIIEVRTKEREEGEQKRIKKKENKLKSLASNKGINF